MGRYDAGSEREAMLQMQLSELEHERREREEQLQDREAQESPAVSTGRTERCSDRLDGLETRLDSRTRPATRII